MVGFYSWVEFGEQIDVGVGDNSNDYLSLGKEEIIVGNDGYDIICQYVQEYFNQFVNEVNGYCFGQELGEDIVLFGFNGFGNINFLGMFCY